MATAENDILGRDCYRRIELGMCVVGCSKARQLLMQVQESEAGMRDEQKCTTFREELFMHRSCA